MKNLSKVSTPKGIFPSNWHLDFIGKHFVSLNAGEFSRCLKESGIIDRWIEEMPWHVIQRGINDGGVFEIITSREVEDQNIPWFLGRNAKENFKKNISLAVSYFESKESAKEYLNQFASPVFDSSMQRHVWPWSIEPALRRQCEQELEQTKKKGLLGSTSL